MEPGNVFTLIFFLLCFLFYRAVNERVLKAGFYGNPVFTRTCAVIAVFFSAFYMSVDYPRYIETLTNPLFRIGIIASALAGYLFLFYYLAKFLYSYTADFSYLSALLFTKNGEAVPLFGTDTDAKNGGANLAKTFSENEFLLLYTYRLMRFFAVYVLLAALFPLPVPGNYDAGQRQPV